ncbi:flavin-containing monooxygenase FMO GS-OX5-like protein [Tanacetum coccineum]
MGPLYKHVFPPQLAPRLSFVGMAERSLILPIVEGQSRWISMVLSKKLSLPSEYEMLSEVEQLYREMKEKGISECRTHSLDFKIDYLEWVYAQFEGVVEKQIKDMHGYIYECLMAHLYEYKDACMQKYGS